MLLHELIYLSKLECALFQLHRNDDKRAGHQNGSTLPLNNSLPSYSVSRTAHMCVIKSTTACGHAFEHVQYSRLRQCRFMGSRLFSPSVARLQMDCKFTL